MNTLRSIYRTRNLAFLLFVGLALFFYSLAAIPMPYAPLNDTGYTRCGDNSSPYLSCPQPQYPGQDGEFGRDVTHNDSSDGHAGFKFTKLAADGTPLDASATEWSCVQDNVTGLVWEVKKTGPAWDLQHVTNTYTWFDSDPEVNLGDAGRLGDHSCTSQTNCDTHTYRTEIRGLQLCGFNDWRLPTVEELYSLRNFNVSWPGPAIDTNYFTVSTQYWSTVTYRADSSKAWTASYFVGGYGGTQSKAASFSVILVRGGSSPQAAYFNACTAATPDNRFVDRQDGAIADLATGLLWKKCPENTSYEESTNSCLDSGGTFIWRDALHWTELVNQGAFENLGYRDWRIPNIKELNSIVAWKCYDPTINRRVFPSDSSYKYWSSTSKVGYDQEAIYVDFLTGRMSSALKSKRGLTRPWEMRIRLVRDPGSQTLAIVRDGTGSGKITSKPVAIDCGGNCSAVYPFGTPVELITNAAADSVFAGWSGDADCEDGKVILAKETNCTATFDVNPTTSEQHTLTLRKSPNGTVTSDPVGIDCGPDCKRQSAQYNSGKNVKLTAKPQLDSSEFKSWEGCSVSLGLECYVMMDKNKRTKAEFSRKPRLTVLKKGRGFGTIVAQELENDGTKPSPICLPNCSELIEQYPENQVVVLTAEAEPGSTFDGWGGNADCGDGQVTMTQDIKCKAAFKRQKRKQLEKCEVDLPDTINVIRAEKKEIEAKVTLTPSDANKLNTEWIFTGGNGGRKVTGKKFSTKVILVDDINTYEVEVRIYSDGNTVLCSDKATFNVEARSADKWKTVATLAEDNEPEFGEEPRAEDAHLWLKVLGASRDRKSNEPDIIIPRTYSDSAYELAQVKDKNGPNDEYWYIKKNKMKIDQETVINKWLKPNHKMKGKDKGKKNWFNYNRDECQPENGFDPAAFLEALKGHENSGVPGKISTGHFGIIVSELAKIGMNPGLEIERMFSSNSTVIGSEDFIEDVDRAMKKIEFHLRTISDHEKDEGIQIEDYGNWSKDNPRASLRNSKGNYLPCVYFGFYM